MWTIIAAWFTTICVAILAYDIILSTIKKEKAEAVKHLTKVAVLLAGEVDTLKREIEQIRKQKAKVW